MTKPISFRLPAEYVRFLDACALQMKCDRTKVLLHILSWYSRALQQQHGQQEQKQSTDEALKLLDRLFK